MLKKLLPILAKLLRRPQSPEQNLPPKSELDTVYSILPRDSIEVPFTHSRSIKLFTILVCFIFLTLVTINWLYSFQLNRLLEKQSSYLDELGLFSDTVTVAKDLEAKLTFIGNARTSRKSMKAKVEYLQTKVVPTVTLQEVSVDPAEFRVKISGKSLTDFSRQIALYLSGDVISQLSIKSVEYSPHDSVNKYKVTLWATFK